MQGHLASSIAPSTASRQRRPAVARAQTATKATPQALSPFFWLACHAPNAVSAMKPLAARIVPLVAKGVREHTANNARRIYGRALTPYEQREFTRDVVSNFYQFVADVGRSGRATPDDLIKRIERVEGEDAYRATRSLRRGAVLVTAHMGSFEVGLAALARAEHGVHVVYKRDASGAFEAMRARMRRMLGVIEAPIDDGLSTWMDLRDALLSDRVVVMQADRAMPGQRSAVVPFLFGHLRVPTGAVRLARLTGSPIVPVFTVRLASGTFGVHLLPAILPGAAESAIESRDPAVIAVTKSIESMVAAYPSQWLVLGSAFEEDATHG